jgi:adenylate cyclase
MGIEIERKYLVNQEKWNHVVKEEKQFWRQGYLLTDANKTIRVRYNEEKGFLTIKSKSVSISRLEFEYEIPKSDAIELLQNFAISVLTKIRYRVNYKNKLWEVDEFLEDNAGLIIAEIELENEHEHYELPEWVGQDVSGDNKYYNSYLSVNPYKNWKDV